MKPATALPWESRKGTTGYAIAQQGAANGFAYTMGGNSVEGLKRAKSGASALDAAYIVHAANAYPRLVQALRSVHEAEEGIGETDRPHFVALRVLLRELGEEQ